MNRRDFIKSMSCAAAATTVPNLFGKEKVNYELGISKKDFKKGFQKGYIIQGYDCKYNTNSFFITKERIADGKLFPFETVEDCDRYISLNYIKLFSCYDAYMDLHIDEVRIIDLETSKQVWNRAILKFDTAREIHRNAHTDESMPCYLGKCLWFELFRLRNSSEKWRYSMTVEEIQKHMQEFSSTIIERCAKNPSHFSILDDTSKAKNGEIALCAPEIILVHNMKCNMCPHKLVDLKTYNGTIRKEFPMEFNYMEFEDGRYQFPLISSSMKGMCNDAIDRITAKKC